MFHWRKGGGLNLQRFIVLLCSSKTVFRLVKYQEFAAVARHPEASEK